MILAAGPLQIPGILEAKALGLRTVAVDGNPQAIGLCMADCGIVANILDPDEIYRIAKQEKVSAIFSLCTDLPMRCLANVAQRLDLPGLSEEAAYNATDKRLMRKMFALHGAPSARFVEVETLADACQAAERLGYPIALKIACGAGSRGISKLLTPDELAVHFTSARQLQPEGALLVEEWLDGEEVSVEGFRADDEVMIVAITDKAIFTGTHPVELGHSQPSGLNSYVQRSIREATVAGVKALGLNWTTFHAELKVTTEGPRLIEIGPRLGGDRISTHLTPLSTGINLVRCGVLLALGKEPAIGAPGQRGATVRYFDAGRTGTLKRISDFQTLYGIPGLELLFPGSERDGWLRAGFEVGTICSSLDRYGHVVFIGEDRNQAVHRAEQALDAILFEFCDGELRNARGQVQTCSSSFQFS
jgi:biotin carboxylase